MKMKDEYLSLQREKLDGEEQDMDDQPCHGESFTSSIGDDDDDDDNGDNGDDDGDGEGDGDDDDNDDDDEEQDMDDEPSHGEPFTGSIGRHSHPNKTHSTWGDNLSSDHRSSTEMPNI